MPSFRHNGHKIAYTEFGSGPRTCVLIHGLLLSQLMHELRVAPDRLTAEIAEFLDACWKPKRRAARRRRATAS